MLEVFIAGHGSDTTGDGTEALPFRTGNWALRPPSAGGPPYDCGCILRFKRGDSYPHLDLNRGGLSPIELFVVTSYGQGPPPVFASISVGRSEPQNFLRIQEVAPTYGTGSSDIGISWRANGHHSTIQGCDIKGFPSALTIQSWNDVTRDYYSNLCVADNLLLNCARVGIYHQGQKDLLITRNVFRDIGTDLLHQGIYSNADNTSYTIEDNIIDNVSNCGIQARSGDFRVRRNIVLRCGYGIATGHGMSHQGATGLISDNLVTLGKDRPNDNAPLTCGIGVCMVQSTQGTPFLVQRNIITDSLGTGNLGGISLGSDLATEYTNPSGIPTRNCGPCLIEGNWVQEWNTALRLVENHPSIFGITSNTFTNCLELARFVNATKWKNLGIRHFADPLSVSQIMQQNTWGIAGLALPGVVQEEGGLGGLLQFPPEWLPAFDPGMSTIPDKDVPNLSLNSYFQYFNTIIATAGNVEDEADAFMDLAVARDPRAWGYLPWARARVGL